jgi:hypothetical protein
MQTRRHVFVVRLRDMLAHEIRVQKTLTAESAYPFIADEDVRSPLGIRWVVTWMWHFQILTKLVIVLRRARRLGGGTVCLADRRTRAAAGDAGETP